MGKNAAILRGINLCPTQPNHITFLNSLKRCLLLHWHGQWHNHLSRSKIRDPTAVRFLDQAMATPGSKQSTEVLDTAMFPSL